MKYQVLDLFSGIGGFSLGLERTGGFETVAFCENDKKAQLVLRKHWPSVPIFDDVKELNHEQLRAESIVPDMVCGGFPCQDISHAGRGVGIEGERSGLWSHMARIIGEVLPRWVIAENVSALRSRGLALVLQNLCALGYCVEWHCIPASAVGAPHRRDRVWIVAYANSQGAGDQSRPAGQPQRLLTGEGGATLRSKDGKAGAGGAISAGTPLADSMQQHSTERGECAATPGQGGGGRAEPGRGSGDAERERPLRGAGRDTGENVADSNEPRLEGRDGEVLQECTAEQLVGAGGPFQGGLQDHWIIEPEVGRVADGVPRRVDRLRQLGNAVVPQIVTAIGHAILELDGEKEHENEVSSSRTRK